MEKKSLTPSDIFGLVSGGVGIIAGAYSIATLLGLTKASISVPFSNWVIMVILIFYAGIVSGFYSRRLLLRINKSKLSASGFDFTVKDFQRIENASNTITAIITAPLLLMFLYSVGAGYGAYLGEEYTRQVKLVNEKYERAKASDRKFSTTTPEEEREGGIETLDKELTSDKISGWFFTGFAGLFLSVIFIIAVVALSREIYLGCDPDYLL